MSFFADIATTWESNNPLMPIHITRGFWLNMGAEQCGWRIPLLANQRDQQATSALSYVRSDVIMQHAASLAPATIKKAKLMFTRFMTNIKHFNEERKLKLLHDLVVLCRSNSQGEDTPTVIKMFVKDVWNVAQRAAIDMLCDADGAIDDEGLFCATWLTVILIGRHLKHAVHRIANNEFNSRRIAAAMQKRTGPPKKTAGNFLCAISDIDSDNESDSSSDSDEVSEITTAPAVHGNEAVCEDCATSKDY